MELGFTASKDREAAHGKPEILYRFSTHGMLAARVSCGVTLTFDYVRCFLIVSIHTAATLSLALSIAREHHRYLEWSRWHRCFHHDEALGQRLLLGQFSASRTKKSEDNTSTSQL